MSEQTQETTKPLILPYQKEVYDRLCAYTRVGLHVPQKSIGSMKIRKNFLVIGPTGTGKTYLSNVVAREMQVPFLSVSIGDWAILNSGSRGCSYTWSNIVEFLKKSIKHEGAIIFVDELDKCYHDTNWNAFLRAEVFSLCDGKIPHGLEDLDDDSSDDDEDVDECDDVKTKESCREELETFIRNHVVIIGGAAFQDLWEKYSTTSMGFNLEPPVSEAPGIHQLARYLPRELVNRFSAELFVLPQLAKNDYRQMIIHMASGISETWRQRFVEIGLAGLDLAVKYQKGVRYAEEVLLETIVKERAVLIDPVSMSRQPDSKPNKFEVDADGDLGIF